jgi:hypothetical protein
MMTLLGENKHLAHLFVESVHDALTGILGNIAGEAVLERLEKDCSIPRRDIPNHIMEFTAAADGIFGRAFQTIERAIAKRFYHKLGLEFSQRTDFRLRDYVNIAILEGARMLDVREEEFPANQMHTVVGFAQRMKPTDHVIMFYSDPEHKHELLFAYLKAALDNGDAAAYVSTQESPDQIKQAMELQGIDVARFEGTGALHVFYYTDWYFLGGEFNMPRTMELWRKLHDEATAKGYRELRVTGEMACFFENKRLNELIAYERALHRVLDVPMTAICAYDIRIVPTEVLRELIDAHSNAIFLGQESQLVAPA